MGAIGRAAFRLRRLDAAALSTLRWVVVYFVMSIAFVTTSKTVLQQLPQYPWTLSCLQCLLAAACARAWIAWVPEAGGLQPVSTQQWLYIVGGSATCWMGFACANVACASMNASLVETIKATTPVPQVALAALLGEGWPQAHVRRALTVIVSGVMLASYADSSANAHGLIATILMNASFALSDNITKLSFKFPDRLNPSNVWYYHALVSVAFAAPAACLELACRGGEGLRVALDTSRVVVVAATFSGLAFFLYNQAICALLDKVDMPTFAVLGSLRRALTICGLMYYFGTEVTLLNVVGLCVVGLGFVRFITGKAPPSQQLESQPPLLPEAPAEKAEAGTPKFLKREVTDSSGIDSRTTSGNISLQDLLSSDSEWEPEP